MNKESEYFDVIENDVMEVEVIMMNKKDRELIEHWAKKTSLWYETKNSKNAEQFFTNYLERIYKHGYRVGYEEGLCNDEIDDIM